MNHIPPAISTYWTVQKEGRDGWSFRTPDGQRFFSIASDCILPRDDAGPPGPHYDGVAANGGDLQKWEAQTLGRLKAWNFNSIGPWSTLRGLPYTENISLGYTVSDVLNPDFEHQVRQHLAENVPDAAALDADQAFIGYFTDNELDWGWEYGWKDPKSWSVFEEYAKLPPEAPSKQAWARYMADTYQGDFEHLSQVWNVDVHTLQELAEVTSIAPRSTANFDEAQKVGDGFLTRVAEKYFEVTDRVMREKLPHHLNFGPKLTAQFPRPVAEVAGRYCDGISIDLYNKDLNGFKAEVQRLHDASGLPVMLGEYSYVAKQNRSGDDNHWYSSCEVDTDAQRGQLYDQTLHMVANLPYVVGAFWFQYFDEPTKGRKDGESSNFGLVDVNNVVYDDLTQAVTKANQAVLQQRESR